MIWILHHGSLAYGNDWDDELLPFGDDHEVVAVVDLGFGGEADDEGDFHAGCDLVAFGVEVDRLLVAIEHLEEPTVRLNDFDAAHELVFISELEQLIFDLKRLVVSESNHIWNALENRFVDRHAWVGIDGVVGQVQKLNDLGLVMLVVDNFPTHLLLQQWAGRQLTVTRLDGLLRIIHKDLIIHVQPHLNLIKIQIVKINKINSRHFVIAHPQMEVVL